MPVLWTQGLPEDSVGLNSVFATLFMKRHFSRHWELAVNKTDKIPCLHEQYLVALGH